MGKIIAVKIGGMSRWAKWSIVLLFTLLTSIFMYKGWYKPLNAEAAIARVQSVTLNNGTNTTGTITIASTHAGNLLVVTIGGIQASTSAVTNVRLGSTALTKAKDIVVAGGPQYVSIWYLANIPAGQTTVTYTSTAVDNGAVVAEYSGIATTNPLDVTATAGSSSATTSTLSTGTATSTAANELWIGAFGDNTSTAFSAVTGTNASMYAQTAANGTQLGLADSTTNSVGSATMGCTGATDWWAGAIAVFKPAGAAAPTVSSISPTSRGQGAASQNITINGANFVSGASASFGTGVTTNSTTFVSATQLTANITVSGSATTGTRTVTVTNPDTQSGSLTNGFTVNAAPTVTSMSPNSMTQGTGPTTVTITGTGFQSGAAVAFSGTGVTTGAVTVVNATSITVPVTVAAGATTGALNVTVTNSDAGAGTGTGVFTVNAPVCTANTPTISVSPASSTITSGGAATTYTVTVTNNDTAACASTVFTLTKSDNNSGVFTSSTLSPTALTLAPGANGSATFTVSATAGAANGASNITTLGVTATGHTAPANITATTTVSNPAPTVTSASPNSGTQGATNLNVTIGGTNFASGATTAFSGTGITVNSTTFVSATQVTANITIAAGATTGARNITVTNPDTQSATLTNGFTVNAAAVCTANIPTLSITPTSATVKSGNNQGYTVTVVNNDTAACASTTFTLSLANSNTTDFSTTSLSPATLTLAPGGNGTASFTVTAGAAAAAGKVNTSTVGVTATGHTAPANVTGVTTVNNTVMSPLTHSSINLGTKYGNWGTTYDCSTCHARGSTNVKRIAQTIITPTGSRNIVFTRMTASSTAIQGVFGDDLRTYAQNSSTNICEVCHHNTVHHQYSSAKITDRTTNPHYNRQDCTASCHLHSAAFKGAGCDGCHGNPPTTANIGGGALNGLATPATGATSPASPGAHSVHVLTVGMKCAVCHTGTTMPTVSNSIQMGFVVNSVNWPGFAGSASFGSFSGHAPLNAPYTGFVSSAAGTVVNTSAAYRNSCNVYCHANWTGSNGSLNPSWTGGPSQAACGTCHGATNAQPPLTGSHSRHAATTGYAYSCTKCHPNANNGANVNFAHVDGSVQWRLSSSTGGPINTAATYRGTNSGATGAIAPSASFGQCASLYCHSNGQSPATYTSPIWGSGALPADCSGCHGNAISNTLSGKHSAHLNPAANSSLGLGNGFGCVNCHAKTVSGNTTISNVANHVNAFIDYSGARAGGSARYSTATKLCTNIYCHSNGNPGAIVYSNPAAWNSGTTYGCNGCHGTSNTNTGAPDYTNGGAGTATANSHPKHVAGAGITDTRGCANCHAKTVDQAVAGKFKDYTAASYHLNGMPNLYFKNIGGKTGTWNGSTCSNTYCHGTAATVPWGSPSLACNACHSANNALPGAHQIHVTTTAVASSYTNMSGNVSSATNYRFSCAACHSPLKGAVHAGGPANANGAAEVFYGFTSATLKGGVYNYAASSAGTDPTGGFSYTAGGNNSGSCNNTYCHSNGRGGNGLQTVNWGTTASSGTCVQCHDTKQTGATATSLSGKHDAHMNPTNNVSLGLNNGFNCIDCHAKTVSNNTTISNKAKHINKFIDYSGVKAGGSARYSTATKSCTTIYCHSNGNPGVLVYVNMTGSKTWTGAATFGCNGCHGRSSAIGAPDYANGGTGTTTANSHAKHVAGATDTTVCSNCHVKTANLTVGGKFKDYTAASYHLNQTPNVIFNTAKAGTTATWTQNTGVCSNVTCHGGTGSSATWGATLNCQDCHGNGAAASVADFGATFWNNGTISKFQMTGTGSWAGNGHGLATGTYAGSGNPAANFGVVTNQCEFCHDPSVGHSLASNPFRLKNYSTAAYGRNAPCLICHSASGAGITIGTTTKKRTTSKAIEADHYGTKHTAALNGGQFCWDCHDPHGTGNSNQYMVRANPAQVSNSATSAPTTQTATAVVFTLSATPTGTDYAKSAAPFNGICNVCHTTTSHYTQTAGDSHNSGTRCTSCHGHTGSIHGSDAFKPTGGHSVPYDTHYVDVRASGNSTCLGCHVMGTTSSVYPAAVAGNPPDCMGCHKKAAPVTTGTGAGANCSSCHGVSTATTANYGRPVGTAFPDRQGYHGGAQDSNHGTAVCSTCHSGLGTSSGSGSGVNHGRGSTTGPVRDGKPDIVGPMVNGITPTNGTKGVSNTPVTCVHGTISSGCSGGGTQTGW